MSMSTSSLDDFCRCGLLVARRTSWTEMNPGRRYLCCPKFRGGCGYFNWIDPPACGRCNQIIPGLIKNINSKDEELEELRKREAFLRKRNMKLWLVIVAFVVAFSCLKF